MSQWEYEANRKIVEAGESLRRAAEAYCAEGLRITYGSLEAGMKAIGTERFETTVQTVMAALPRSKK